MGTYAPTSTIFVAVLEKWKALENFCMRIEETVLAFIRVRVYTFFSRQSLGKEVDIE
jgi:hypothetical protein